MKSLTISISQKLWRFPVRQTIKRQVPEAWSELDRATMERVVYLFYQKNHIHVTKLLCLKALIKISWLQFFLFLPEFKKLFTNPDGELDTLINYVTGFLFEGFAITNAPYTTLHKFYGPQDYLDGLTTQEFIIADHHFHKYVQHEAAHDLNCLIAVLYRLPGEGPEHNPTSRIYCGDIREAFNQATVERRAKYIAKLPKTKRLVVLSFYRSCRHIWEQQFDLVFTKSNEETVKSKSYGWFEVLKAVSANDFGTIEMKEKVPIGNIFLSMQIDIRDVKKTKSS